MKFSLNMARITRSLFSKALMAVCLASLGAASANATVTVSTMASGSAPCTSARIGGSGAFINLTGPVIDESTNGDIGAGTIVLSAPAGWEFDSTATVTATASKLGGNGNTLTTSSPTLSASAFTFTVTADANNGSPPKTWSRITVAGLRIRPINTSFPGNPGYPGTNPGNITNTGTATINGLTSTSSYGVLTETAGAATQLGFGAAISNTTIGTAINPAVTVQVQDQYGNLVTTATNTITISSSNLSFVGSTLTATAVGGVATFSAIKPATTGINKTLTASASGLTSATSSTFTTAMSLTAPTTVWRPVLYGPSSDYSNDTQAKAPDLDLVGNANNPVLYSYYDDGGTSAADTDDNLYFRVRLGGSKSSSSSVFTSGYVFLGVDVNNDGKIDFFISITRRTNNEQRISVWSAGSGLNVSPSTTSLTGELPIVNLATSPSFYDFSSVTTTNDPATNDVDLNTPTTLGTTPIADLTINDQFLSFKIPFNNSTPATDSLKEALAAKGIAITKNTPLRIILATSTQSNSLNSDLNGYNGGVKSSITYINQGAFSPPMSFSNSFPVITSNGGGSTAQVIVSSGTTAVTTVTATDADNDPLGYSISGGANASLFSIDPSTGILTFKAAATPGTYVVQVKVNDLVSPGGAIKDVNSYATQTITVTVPNPADTTPPTVVNISSPVANGQYEAGTVIPIQVQFSKPVAVTGTPTLTLATTPVNEVVSYTSGSGGNILTFNYTVQAGDTSPNLDCTGTGSLALSGGTITDGAGHNAALTLPNPGATGSLGVNNALVIDTTAPAYVSGTASGSTVVLQFSDTNPLDALNPPSASMFSVTINGTAVAISQLTVNSTAKTVTLMLATAATNGQNVAVTYTDPAGDDAYAIQDLAGNDVATFSTGNINATPDTTPPQILWVSAYDATGAIINGQFDQGNVIPIQVQFSEPVIVTGTPTLTLATGSVNEAVSYSSGSGQSVLTFNYTVQPGDTSADLEYLSTSALSFNGGTIKDAAGNSAILTLAPPGATNSLSSNNDIIIDTTAPVYVSGTANGNTVILNYTETNSLDSINIPPTSVFAVTVGGVTDTVSSLAVDPAGNRVILTLATAIMSGQSVTVAYTDPTAGDDANAVQDVAGNDAATFAATAVANTTGDVTPPTLTSINDNAPGHLATIGQTLTYTVTFSKLMDSSTLTSSVFTNTGTAPITFGTITQVSNGVFSVQVTPTSIGTIILQIAAGAHILDTAGNALNTTTNLSGGVATVTVQPANQTITFGPIPNHTYGDAAFTVSATASSGLPVTLAVVSGPATISGNTITITGTGTVDVQATQAGNTYYNAAPSVDQTFTVGPASQTITFGAIPNHTYGDAAFTVSATATSGLPVTLAIASGPATISGGTITITGTGTVDVKATQAGNSLYSTATPVDQTFTVGLANQTIAFGAIPNHTYGDAAFTLGATASSGLAVTYTVVSGPATVTGNTLTITGVGTVDIRASQGGSSLYNAATPVDQTFTVGPANQTITFGSISNHIYGDPAFTLGATASSGLAVTYTVVSGPATVSGNTLTITGVGTVDVQASQAGNTQYNAAANVDQTFTVGKGNQTITFGSIPNHAFGDAPITLGATASSGLAVTYTVVSGPATVSGNTLTITGVGTVDVKASQPGNPQYNAAADVDQTFTVGKGNQTITFGSIPNHVYGDAPFTLGATASSGLAVTYTVVSGPATVSGNTLTITGVGTVDVKASQPGNPQYNAAADVDQTFTVGKSDQTITFGTIPNHAFGDAPITLGATASSGLTVTYIVVSGPATVSGNTLTITGVGTVDVRASQAGSPLYNSAADVDQTFTVGKSDQTITFGSIPNHVYGDAPFALGATASSGLAVTYTVVSGPATVSGNTLTITGVGTVDVKASQAGNPQYNPAADVDQTFTVGKSDQTITFGTIPNHIYGDAPITLGATASSGLAVTYTLVSGPATVSGNTLTITGVGTVDVKASQAGNPLYNSAPDVDQTFSVGKGNQTITFGTIPNHVFGDAPFALGATASSGLAVTYTVVSGPATVSGNTLTITGVGTVDVKASQPGNPQYNAAADVDQTFTVGKGNQTITFGTIPNHAFGDAPITLGATASSGLAVTYTVVSGPATVSGNTLTITGVGTVDVKASQSGNPQYNAAADVDQTFTVGKGDQTITFGAIPDHKFGDAPITLGATASSGLAVTYTVVSGPATVSGNTLTITGIGTVDVKASQAGNPQYNQAPDVDQTFAVGKSDQTITFGTIPNHVYGDSPITLGATASSGLAVTYTVVSGPATVSGNTLTITGAGTVDVRASQAGNPQYNAAASVDQTFTVALQDQTITFGAIPNHTYGDAPITLGATASSGLAVTYTVISGPATVTGNTLTITDVGTVDVRASQPGNGNYNAAPTVDQTFTVGPANQTITFGPIPNHTLGDAPISLNATASSGLAVIYTVVSGPATVAGNVLTLTGVGTVDVQATQPGNTQYNAAPSVDQTFTVAAGIDPLAKINLRGNGVSILNGDVTPAAFDSTDFGRATVGVDAIQSTFAIESYGTSTVQLTGTPVVAISGANAGDFILTQPAATSVPAGSSVSFTITFQPTGAGLRTATISIGNNSTTKNPYTFMIQGTGTSDDHPIDLTLNGGHVTDHAPASTAVGTFVANPDLGSTDTFQLVPGTGSTDNSKFTIVGNTLKINAPPDVTIQPTYSIRVQVSDNSGGVYEKVFTIYVMKVESDEGDFLIADRGPYNSTGTILLVTKTGHIQKIITTTIKDPYEMTVDANGNYVIADYQHNLSAQQISPDGGIYTIDRQTGAEKLVSSGAPFVTPLGVKVESSGSWIVADADAYNYAGAIFRVDSTTGAKTLLSTGGNFYYIQGLALAPNGDIYVSDEGTPKKIIKVDPVSGAQTVITTDGNLQFPVGLAVQKDGKSLVVVDAYAKALISVSLPDGQQTVISADSQFVQPTHVAIEDDGNYLVTDGKSVVTTRRLYRVDKGTGIATQLSLDGFFEQPRGVSLAK